MEEKNTIIILDFGSQFTQLIARRLRELHVYCKIVAYDTPLETLLKEGPKGFIFSGGPHSVLSQGAPLLDDVSGFRSVAPILGICYGMQLLCHKLGGLVEASDRCEYGFSVIKWKKPLCKVGGRENSQKVWMSHGDVVKIVPPEMELLAESENGHPAAVGNGKDILCLQFHPEVVHTEGGTALLDHFVTEYCHVEKDWKPENIVEQLLKNIRDQVPKGALVLCALSGGVDSTVVGTLLVRALGADRVHCVFVDTGLLRKNEYEEVLNIYAQLKLSVMGVNAKDLFYERLAGVFDPEQKRKIIGHSFIDVFKEQIAAVGDVQYLAQGTLYPDVIESISLRGNSVTIKSHHNVGGLPKDLNLELVEPLRWLFKDEVRMIGEYLGIPKEFLWRHPFPGPGLAIRILGEVTEERVSILQACDDIYISMLKSEGLYNELWQAFCVLLPVKTVGVQGDNRTYESLVAIRGVTSQDGMTADWYNFSTEFLTKLSNTITNRVQKVNRVVLDITSKPPGTIEWE